MSTVPETNSKREAALTELAALTTIERGTLTEEYREQPSSEGGGTVRRGPYFKHQCWENGKNRSVRVPGEQVAQLRQDLENGRRFEVLTEQLAQLAIEQGRAQRAAQSAASGPVDIGAKKNSRPSASRKDTAKQKPSSRRSVKRSPRKG
jgi:hypothetical protein